MQSYTHATTTQAQTSVQASMLQVRTPVTGRAMTANHNETLVRVTPRA